jgi:predicted transcriptional regulator
MSPTPGNSGVSKRKLEPDLNSNQGVSDTKREVNSSTKKMKLMPKPREAVAVDGRHVKSPVNNKIPGKTDSEQSAEIVWKSRAVISASSSSEPLRGLWQFFRSILHNPKYNPKIISWENLAESTFRIHSLPDFYKVWKKIKKSNINYELLQKTLKIYEEEKLLENVPKLRCVYRFGPRATDWEPRDHELIFAGKRPVPNQERWPQSRFYQDFIEDCQSGTEAAADAIPQTLYTLTPLDHSVTGLAELKVLTDNSRIVKTFPKESKKMKDGSDLKNLEHVAVKNDDWKSDSKAATATANEKKYMEVPCTLLLPLETGDKPLLKFGNSCKIELDQRVVEEFIATNKGQEIPENKVEESLRNSKPKTGESVKENENNLEENIPLIITDQNLETKTLKDSIPVLVEEEFKDLKEKKSKPLPEPEARHKLPLVVSQPPCLGSLVRKRSSVISPPLRSSSPSNPAPQHVKTSPPNPHPATRPAPPKYPHQQNHQ